MKKSRDSVRKDSMGEGEMKKILANFALESRTAAEKRSAGFSGASGV